MKENVDYSKINRKYYFYLSDSYVSAGEKYGSSTLKPDLEATVHVYDFRMTLNEVLAYIEQEILPERFKEYDNDLRNYALVANGITYMQRIGNDSKYIAPVNVTNVAEYLELLLNRDIFVDLLSDKEVCDMTMAQFSRDDILIYQGREEGREEEKEQSIRNMAEAYQELNADAAIAKQKIMSKYADMGEMLINAIIAEVYKNK